jgi:hypothetical protein
VNVRAIIDLLMPTTINGALTTNGPVYANGPVYVQGVDVRQALENINARLGKIERDDLPKLRENIQKLLDEFPIAGQTKSHLEKIRDWIDAGHNLVEIIQFIQSAWVELGPIVTEVLLKK